MDTEIRKALIYGATIIVAVGFWSASNYFKARLDRYELHTAGTVGLTFLLNKRSGAIWRYYRNTDTNGKFSDEGFSLVREPAKN
jgi:hypothetical protein